MLLFIPVKSICKILGFFAIIGFIVITVIKPTAERWGYRDVPVSIRTNYIDGEIWLGATNRYGESMILPE